LIQYIGLPYSFSRFNCWDFVVIVRKDNGLKCDVFRPKKLREAFNLIMDHLHGDHAGLEKVKSLQNYDIIMCEKEFGKDSTFHCGIFYNGLVYHCDRSKGQVTYDNLDDFSEPYKSVTFWR